MCVVHLYVRTFGMRRACEIVRCTLMWREMQTCIHEVCMDRHVQRYVHSKSQPSFFFLNCSGAIRLFSNQFRLSFVVDETSEKFWPYARARRGSHATRDCAHSLARESRSAVSSTYAPRSDEAE